jgi:hypothetical protein
MVTLTSCIFQNGDNVFRFKIGVILKHLLVRGAGSEKIQDILDPNAQPPNAWASSADAGGDRYPVQFAHLSGRHVCVRLRLEDHRGGNKRCHPLWSGR